MQRRIAILAATVSLALTGCGKDEASPGDDTTATTDTTGDTSATGDTGAACFALPDGSCVVETFANPPVLAPNADGVYELELGPVEFTVGRARHCGRAFNGSFLAPTIDVAAQAGGVPRQVRVDLRNAFTKSALKSLSGETCTCEDADGETCTPGGHEKHAACRCTNDKGEMCHVADFNLTNLHAHGSHVRPDYASGGGCVERDGLSCRACSADTSAGARECYFADDVISRVEPGEGIQVRWDLDEAGVAHEGTNWYHPHIHGSTAIQVVSGAAGALIVRGAVDALPGIAKARERVIVVSTPPTTFPPLADGQACDEDHLTFDDFPTLGDTAAKEETWLNGVHRPRMVTPPGQIERWRIVHTAFLDETYLALFRGKDSSCEHLDVEAGPVALTQIARDGLTLPRPPDDDGWPYAPPYMFLSPGYRVDAMLDGSGFVDGDTLCLMSARFMQADDTGTRQAPVGIPKAPTVDELLQATTNGDLVAIVNFAASAGEATETHMPDLAEVATHAPSLKLQGGAVDGLARCAEAEAETDVTKIDQLAAMWLLFYNTDKLDACGFPDHNINGKNFETTDRHLYPYDRVLKLGAVEHWRVVSGFDGHPFHIHINPFLVCPLPKEGTPGPNVKGRIFEPPFAHWRDTYLVNLDRSVDMLEEYKDFTGAFVMHCHKLHHEDHGMMELIDVCDPEKEDCDGLCASWPCRWDACVPGDADCERPLAATLCLFDPARCAEAALRCTPCAGDGKTCPPDARCADDPSYTDGVERCVPGCLSDGDCLLTERCGGDGQCEPAPACAPPCAPGTTCQHGACE
ncbi:MAG: multicopper oxidase domain-containing protein [Myxococcales bacterium]|nr:multicopper oxidase domain-containing protein [Myxococcales bacterium]